MTSLCKHCQCDISGEVRCQECDARLPDQCLCCHREVSHGVIVNQNLHFVGSGSSSPWDDDAFRRSDSN